MRCTLTWTCPKRKVVGHCCFYCPERDNCEDACQNRPDRCIVSRESTPREKACDYGMKSLKKMAEFKRIAETGQPLGLFYVSDCRGYIAMDNRTGTPVVSEGLCGVIDAIEWLADRVDADMETGKEVQHER